MAVTGIMPLDPQFVIPLSGMVFGNSSYSAEEFLSVRIPVSDPNISYMDFVTPIVNIKDKSIQGVASMVTLVKHPIPETFVQRMVGFSYACERSTKIPSLHRWGT